MIDTHKPLKMLILIIVRFFKDSEVLFSICVWLHKQQGGEEKVKELKLEIMQRDKLRKQDLFLSGILFSVCLGRCGRP